MAYAYTSDELIAQVKRRAMIPSSSNTLATADFLSFINDEMDTYMVPLVMSVKEEFYVTYADTSCTSSTTSVAIPERAIGGKLRNVLWSSDGGIVFYPLERIEAPDVYRYSTTGSAPQGYYFEGNRVILKPFASGTLRLQYFIHPSRCVALADASVVSSTTSTTVVVASVGTNFGTAAANYDFIKGTGPGWECRAIDQSGTRSSTTLTFSGGVTTALVATDYVALANETPVPQLPRELHPLLAQRVAVRALYALGFTDQARAAEAECDRLRREAIGLLTPRSEGSARYVINRNGPGWPRLPGFRGDTT